VVPPLERAPTVETAAQLTAPPSPRPLAGDVRPASYPTSSGSGGRQAESPSPTASTLHAEIDLLNAARVALSAGDRPRALELLEGFETQFPEGVLRPEAAILRLDALVASGDRPAAARVARAFLAANPSSPYAPRIQRLMSQSNP
jgi:outer membrane protein assembly factor BamD (BamD/ComL family)